MSDFLNHPDVRRALELAAKGTAEDDVPRELKHAVHLCIASGLAKFIRAYAVIPDRGEWDRTKGEWKSDLIDRVTVLPADATTPSRKFLLLQDQGEVELAKLRLSETSESPPVDEWSEVKPKAEWRKELKISETTWRRHVASGLLVTDEINNQKVRIRKDCLSRLRGA